MRKLLVAVVAAVSILTIPPGSPARAADPPVYYAVALGLAWSVESVAVVNDDGVVAGRVGRNTVPILARMDGTAIESFPVEWANPTAINSAGAIVGGAASEAFRADASTVSMLGTLGGAYSFATDINEAGVVVGISTTSDDEQRGFVHDGTTMAPLGTLPGGGSSAAVHVNDTGVISGTAVAASGDTHVVTWQGATIIDHGSLGGPWAQPLALNDAGAIAGYATTPGGSSSHAFVSQGGPIVDIGTFGGANSSAADMNAAGQVVGYAQDAAGTYRAFLWDDGPLVDLGTLGGSTAQATAISDDGLIVGSSTLPGDTVHHAFVVADGTMYDINDLLPPESVEVTDAYAIADSGHIIGQGPGGAILLVPGPRPAPAYDVVRLGPAGTASADVSAADANAAGQATGEQSGRAFRFDGSTFDLFAPANAYSYGRAINEAGIVAGTIEQASAQAFIFDGAITPLGTLGGADSYANDINDAGDVVGEADTATGERHAFIYRDGVMTDLGGLGGTRASATRINEAGTVIGEYRPTPSTFRAFVWDGTTMTDLGTLGGSATWAAAINDAGQIVGSSATATGASVAFLGDGGGIDDISPPGSTTSYAVAINADGVVVGTYETASSGWRPFIYDDGTHIFIPYLDGQTSAQATDVDDEGRVIGTSTSTQLGGRAFLYEDGAVTDLDDLIPSGFPVDTRYPVEITDSGVILVRGSDETGLDRSFLLVPTSGPPPDPDGDGDGIWDSIEDPGVTGGFLDTSTEPDTVGRIVTVPSGLSAVVEDATDPADGVRVVVSGSGTDKVTFNVCGLTVKLAAGSDVVFTCGSLIARVIAGEAEIELAGGLTIVTIPEGGHAEVDEGLDGTISVDNLGTAPVTVVVDGATTTVAPGDTADIGAWDFQGFSAPVDMPPDLNAVKAGQSVPFRWRLVGADGAPVSDLDAVRIRVTSLPCPLGSTADQLEETGAGASGLQNLGDGFYQYNWKTPKGYARSCKTAFLEIGGVERSALFSFTK